MKEENCVKRITDNLQNEMRELGRGQREGRRYEKRNQRMMKKNLNKRGQKRKCGDYPAIIPNTPA